MSGCADPYRNLYQGMQQREAIANPLAKPADNSIPYDQYQAERDKLQHPNSEKTNSTDVAK